MSSISTLSNPAAQAEIAEALNQSVAETAVTTMLAQNFHWNVTGMAFGPLHDLFQTDKRMNSGQSSLYCRVWGN